MRHHISTANKIYIIQDSLILLTILVIIEIFLHTYHITLTDTITQVIGLGIAVLLLFITQFMFDVEEEYYDLLQKTRRVLIDEYTIFQENKEE